jgi:hypothetical protein
MFSNRLQNSIFFSHHFGYQCKVQTYGFSRLIDLLEELSHVVKVNNQRNEDQSKRNMFVFYLD